jgi:hypothetical protein
MHILRIDADTKLRVLEVLRIDAYRSFVYVIH